jgi:hypothetical protein
MSTEFRIRDLVKRWEALQREGREVSPEELCDETPELVEQVRAHLRSRERPSPSAATPAADVTQDMTPEQPPTTTAAVPHLPGYEILGRVGQGGIGCVFEARELALDRVVALKVLRAGSFAGPQEVERFRLEARAMAQLDHPNVVPIYGTGEHQELPYFTLRFMRGGSLAQCLPRFTGDPRAAVALVEKVARAVQYLHDKRILHRDLKPSNILLDERGEPGVSDFGLAKFVDADFELTQPGMVVGTLAYMAPEQADGLADRISPLTDVWALGVILYELLTGRRPFEAKDRGSLCRRICKEAPPLPRVIRSDLDPRLEGIVLKCLKKDPARRYASAGLLADDLRQWLAGEPVAARRPPWPPRLWHAFRRRPMAAVIPVLVATVVGLVVPVANRLPRPVPVEESEHAAPAPAPPIRLIGNRGPSPPLTWGFGKEHVRVAGPRDGAFSIQAHDDACLELRRGAQWPHFRFEAELQQQPGADAGKVGIYYAHDEYGGDVVKHPVFALMWFADHGPHQGKLQCQLAYSVEVKPSALATGFFPGKPRRQEFEPASTADNQKPWRRLAIEVNGEDLLYWWGNELIATGKAGDAQREGDGLFKGTALGAWRFNPHGGIGLYLDDGAVSFRNVVLTPLP